VDPTPWLIKCKAHVPFSLQGINLRSIHFCSYHLSPNLANCQMIQAACPNALQFPTEPFHLRNAMQSSSLKTCCVLPFPITRTLLSLPSSHCVLLHSLLSGPRSFHSDSSLLHDPVCYWFAWWWSQECVSHC
jgi:hypothetical protein